MKNLKHGLRCSKTDVVLLTRFFVSPNGDCPFDFEPRSFPTKLEAINYLTGVLADPAFTPSMFLLYKVQSIKFY